MSKQLNMIVHDYLSMSFDEQLALVQQIRKNKYTIRPAAQKHKKRAAKSKVKPTANKLAALLNSLPEDQRAAVLASLQGTKDA